MTRSKMNFAWVIGVLAVFVATVAHAQTLDMGSLSQYDYSGQDELNEGSNCRLSVSPIGKDFSGRFYQDFRIWVEGRPLLSFNIRLRGGGRTRAPDQMVDGKLLYNIALETNRLQLLTDPGDPLLVTQFNFTDLGGVTGSENSLIRCKTVTRKKR